MGIDVRLENENGKEIEVIIDEKDFLSILIQKKLTTKTKLIKYINPYGDTTFNKLQMKDLVNDLKVLLAMEFTEEQKLLLEEVKRLAEKCIQEHHTYLKFYGD